MFDEEERASSIPKKEAIPSPGGAHGPYFYDERVSDFAAKLKPLPRGEHEITGSNRESLAWDELKVEERGVAGWTQERPICCWRPRSSFARLRSD